MLIQQQNSTKIHKELFILIANDPKNMIFNGIYETR